MNYIKIIKSAFDHKAVRIALYTLPPAALVYYLSRKGKDESFSDTKQLPESNSNNNIEAKENNSGLPEPGIDTPEVLEVDNLPPDKSVEILNENPLTGETTDFGECIAISSKGTRCKRKAVDSSHYCWQHKKLESNGKE